jgi:peptide/nickel transport system substrate-binding protein
MSSRWLAVLSIAVACAATRPHYGGTLKVQVRDAGETADPPQKGPGMADLGGAFNITHWEAGRRAVYSADENAAGGRPYLDSVEIEMARPLREQSIDFKVGRADVIELAANEPLAGRRVWSSSPVRVMALAFGPRVDDARLREALALAVDRAAIHNVLLQRQGEISGALLPQWLSGYAFLFATSADVDKARQLVAGLPAAARSLTIGFTDPAVRPIAERIALNARYAGLALTVAAPGSNADVRLVQVRVESSDPWRALAGIATGLGLPEPPRAESPDALYAAERSLLDGFRVIPLFHLPDIMGAATRVRGGPGITHLGEWRFENLWLEGGRP